MKAMGTPGLALALFDREKHWRVSAFGLSDLEDQTPVRPDALFEIGSITKSFTAVAVVQAVEAGLIDLDAAVTDYLPWFQVQSQYAPITIGHLLNHTAGIVGIIDRSPDPRAAVWALRETETAWPPGTRFHYSDAGYQTLALVLEAVVGQSFPEIIRSHIFEPLQMTTSEPALTHAIRGQMARGYSSLFDDRPYHAGHRLTPVAWIETNAGDCCIAATAGDMAQFGRMLLNQGQGHKSTILSAAGYELLTREPIATGWGFAYGYGLEIHHSDEVTYIGHGGGMPGYEAFLLLDTTNGLGVSLLSTQPSIGIRALAWKMMNLWRSVYLDHSLDTVDLSLPDPTNVENATDFSGAYHSGDKALTLTAEKDRLLLHHQDETIVLEKRANDQFYVNHLEFDRFLLAFERNEAGRVTEAYHGPDWYVNDRYSGPTTFDYPQDWDAYPGHYRAHIPWQTNFRVILRKGALRLVWPSGDEESLIPLSEGVFGIGDEVSPERLHFKQIVNGQALCANLSGSDYYRFFTP